MAVAERKKSVRDPLMVAASEYAKASRRLADLEEQKRRVEGRLKELDDRIFEAEKDKSEADMALRGVPLATT